MGTSPQRHRSAACTLAEVKAVSAADPLPLADQARRRVGPPDQPDVPPVLATQQFALPGYLRAIGTRCWKAAVSLTPIFASNAA
jgi:hypothetical protein